MEGRYIFGSIAVLSLGAVGTAALVSGVDGTLLAAIIGGITAITGALLGYNKGLYKTPPSQ